MFAGPLPAMIAMYPRLVAALGVRAKVERTFYPGQGTGFTAVGACPPHIHGHGPEEKNLTP